MKRKTGKFKSIAFGEYAEKWRARCKISRRDMAKITDLDYTSIYKFETGRIKSLYILSAYIHCGFDPVYELTRPENRSEEDEN